MTPELPRAPRSRAEAVTEAACPTVAGCFFAQLGSGGADGQAHVGARVSVGDGEHVEFIDGLLFRLDRSRTITDHIPETDAPSMISIIVMFLPFGAVSAPVSNRWAEALS